MPTQRTYAFVMWLVLTVIGGILVITCWTSTPCTPVQFPMLVAGYVGGALLCSSVLMTLPVVFRQLFHGVE